VNCFRTQLYQATQKLEKKLNGQKLKFLNDTSDINYMLKGLQELAEYIYLIKNTDIVDNYIIENEGNSDIEIEGILFADKVKIDKDLDFLNNITPKIKIRTM
jgi:hypothetical protein